MLTPLPALASPQLTARHGFNDAAIDWHLFEDGKRLAQRAAKPILFVAHTTWCPHCVSYRDVFFDKTVVELVRAFIPVIVDRDLQGDVSARFAPDGDYVPRTMILTPKGKLVRKLRYTSSKYNYFVDYDDPSYLSQYLQRAIRHFA